MAPPTDVLGNILITGAAGGLGRSIAHAVEKTGGTPLVLDKDPCDAAWISRQVDLVDTAAAEQAVVDLALEAGDVLDGVVTAAAMDTPADFADIDRVRWERIVTVNLFGTAAVIRAALPWLERSRGRIVTVASTLGLRALPAATAYAASKHGVVGFTRALTLELAGRVGVTMLVPGGMATRFFDGRDEQFKPAPDQPLNDPDDVAATVLFALQQPPGCEVRELIVTPSVEPSWP